MVLSKKIKKAIRTQAREKTPKNRKKHTKPSQKRGVVAKKAVKRVSSSVVSSTTTSKYIDTPRYMLRSWGCFYPSIFLHVEQVKSGVFLYKYHGYVGLATVKSAKDEVTKKMEYWIEVKKQKGNTYEQFYFKKYPISCRKFYNTPSMQRVEAFVKGEYVPRSFKQIARDISTQLSILYDFKFPQDITTWLLHIGQSWLTPLLKSVFFVGVDSCYGGGKTTLLENAALLKRHGFLGGDVSAAAIPRLVDELALNVSLDELDEKIKSGEDDTIALLRKGQRKDNRYVRCEGKNHVPVAYELFGAHDYSYRSDTEDAFANRSLKTHSAVSTDRQLPIVNIFKKQILKPLSDELFLWNLQNLLSIYKENSKLIHFTKNDLNLSSCSDVAGSIPNPKTIDIENIKKVRKIWYDKLTSHFDGDTLAVFNKLTGRNVELSFIAFHVSKLLGLDVFEDLKHLMETKQEDESVADNYYMDALHEHLRDIANSQDTPALKDGLHSPCKFYPKNLAYRLLVQKLINTGIATIGTRKFASLLRDIGFIQGDNLVSERWQGIPKPCLIFTEKILKRLFPAEEEEKPESEEVKEK